MPFRSSSLFVANLLLISAAANAEPGFTGTWTIDLRTPTERTQKTECGTASFTLVERKTRVSGSHSMATAGCGRLNEGPQESVKGVVVGRTAVLVVTSARNGAVYLGTATLRNGALHWQVVEVLISSPLLVLLLLLAFSTSRTTSARGQAGPRPKPTVSAEQDDG